MTWPQYPFKAAPPIATWWCPVRERADDPVVYRGQIIIDDCPANQPELRYQRDICTHNHLSREGATACAAAVLATRKLEESP